VPMSSFALKGGSNLRFFFGSVRYSEDMDLDAWEIPVHTLRDKVMGILSSTGMIDTVRTYGIEQIRPPNIARAKQTETVQRFKVQLVTTAGEELFTKIEFSRRGHDPEIRSEPVMTAILSVYRMAPLIVPHYTATAAIRQKILALALRRQPQSRDVFDLFLLTTQHVPSDKALLALDVSRPRMLAARERIYGLEFAQFRDAVVSFLSLEDREAYESPEVWDEIRLRVVALLESAIRDEG